MRPELQAKLLQHMNKKKADKGFTLVELLVVIVIIGILTAIALPNFLSQSAKAKQAEAKQNISAVNRAQVAYRTDNTTFATGFDQLALGTVTGGATSSTATFDYALVGATDSSNSTATSKDTAVKGYAGGTLRATNNAGLPVVTALMCEANTPGLTTPAAISGSTTLACGTNTTAVK